uniref:Secreted protein n=1 Tax=Steinernema glaseri TaxID=37863 RepID=A0A1I7ZTV2_9BILA
MTHSLSSTALLLLFLLRISATSTPLPDGGTSLCESRSNDSAYAEMLSHFKCHDLGFELEASDVINTSINTHVRYPYLWSVVLFLNLFALVLFVTSVIVTLVTWDSRLPDSYFIVYMRDAIVTLSRLEDQANERFDKDSIPASLLTE